MKRHILVKEGLEAGGVIPGLVEREIDEGGCRIRMLAGVAEVEGEGAVRERV